MDEKVDQIESLGVVPVVAIRSAASAAPLADALTAGGLPCAEITLRTEAGLAAIAELAQREGLLVGAGTVHRVEQAKQVVDAGASFIVSPGMNPKMVAWCIDENVPVFPGVATPTDLEMALELNLQTVKFFPAEAMGGTNTLKAYQGPYGQIRFLPTGGISPANLSQYLSMPNVVACGGSWMVKSDLIEAGEFDRIETLVTETCDLVRQVRA